MRKNICVIFLVLVFCMLLPCSNAYTLPLYGFAQSNITNLNITISDIHSLNVKQKGMYPAHLNGTHATSYANDRVSGIIQTQTVDYGFAVSSTTYAQSFAEVTYIDIVDSSVTNSIYKGINYNASANGLTDAGTKISSYSVINDYWLFTATAPVSVTISFDFILSASGDTENSQGSLTTEAAAGLGMGLNDTTWYMGDFTNIGLSTGSFSMNMDYLTGDTGKLFIWNSAGVISSQSLPVPVPEPSTMLLFGTAMIGYLGTRLKK